MLKRVLISAVALASACDAFSFVPANPLTAAGVARRANVLPQPRSAQAPALGLSLRSLKAVASSNPQTFAFPPVLGLGFKALGKRLVVITGTTSGLGLATLKSLVKREDSFVVCAVRDTERMKNIIKAEGLDESNLAVLQLDLGSFQSVRDFVFNLKAFKSNFPLDSLVCNAATYQPATPEPRFTVDGFEESLQINHLSHFLLCSLLIDDMKKSSDPRMIVVGSITGNTNTVGGGAVWPKASLGDFAGMQQMLSGAKNIPMIDGKNFNGAKAYKDSKLCNMQTILELNDRFHESTGITFSTMYPGCIAETQLFREKRLWFRKFFPVFMKYVTGGYVSEEEAGDRLAQCVWDERCKDSGKYWSWNGGAKRVGVYSTKDGYVKGAGGAGGGTEALFPNMPSAEVQNKEKRKTMFELSTELTGAKWPAK